MINKIYKLTEPRKIEIEIREEKIDINKLVIRPTYLSICAADKRYFNGNRPKEILAKKLPMSLIHEAIGKVVYDPQNKIKIGTEVVMLPNLPTEENKVISENYLRSSKFRSSSDDGFMQELIIQDRDRIVKLPKEINREVLSFLELISVSFHGIDRFEQKSHSIRDTFGIWGDGNLGFIVSLILKKKYPESKIIVFGKNKEKLSYFSFVDETVLIDEIENKEYLDHAFECVGGLGSQYAINQIIDIIKPEGNISLMGVSEEPIAINTRMTLEKGLTLLGNSRSTKKNFESAVNLFVENPKVEGYLSNLVSCVEEIKSIEDIHKAFEMENIKSWGKTILKWRI